MIRVLQQTQVLPIDVKAAWAFFSRPDNLNDITPADLSFKVLSELPAAIYAGLMIRYKIQPFPGVQLNWLTEITHVDEPHYFVDEQRVGPYALWHHEHHFKEVPGGTEMTDIVHYRLPLGRVGNLFHGLLVGPKLKRIFDYRKEVLGKKFK
ncbi:MAG: SRPBCC family protein [Bacteroidota bacterium]